MSDSKAKFRVLNIRALVEDFKQQRITEFLNFKYLLAEFLLLFLGVSLTLQVPPYETIDWLVSTAILILVLVIGTIYAFKQNERGDNKEFTARYIAVNFVISMRFFVATLLFIVAFSIIAGAFMNPDQVAAMEANTSSTEAITAFATVLYYYFVGKYIHQIAN